MIRNRPLASIDMALAAAVIVPAETLPAETSAPTAHQASRLGDLQNLLHGLPYRSQGAGRLEPAGFGF